MTVKQIQNLDRIAIEQYGVPSLVLMENAGRSVAFEVLKLIKDRKQTEVDIFCGLGNNAGDGFVVARHLINQCMKTKIFIIGQAKNLKSDALVNYQILKRLHYPIKEIQVIDKAFLEDIRKSEIIVDAIFGVGLNREIHDPFRSVIETLNRSQKRIVAVDTPSGLDGTTGKIYGVCVKAYMTVTFSFIKRGFLKNQGPKYVGRIVVVDIGIPKRLKDKA